MVDLMGGPDAGADIIVAPTDQAAAADRIDGTVIDPWFATAKIQSDFRIGVDPDGTPFQSDGDPNVGFILVSASKGESSGVFTIDASADPDDGGDSDNLGCFGSQVRRDARPSIVTQTVAVDVAAFNAVRDVLIAFGLVINGDD